MHKGMSCRALHTHAAMCESSGTPDTAMQPDFSPSAERNKQPILEVLQRVLPPQGKALEIASGTGQHVVWFAQHLPQWEWQPTDMQRGALYNIDAYLDQTDLTNVWAPMQLSVMQDDWLPQGDTVDLVLCINMLHIAPWATCDALMRGAARVLAPEGRLITYGPYLEDGIPTTDTNLAFDASLRAHDPTHGLRRREDVQAVAATHGLRLQERVVMPANNLLLVFGRDGVARA